MTKIPKTIHYCWFGQHPMPLLYQACFDTWTKLEGYTLKRWDESNIPENKFIMDQLANKNWAFVSDYVRLYALYTEGGIYLDTDFEIIKDFDSLLDYNLFLCREDSTWITNGAMGSIKGHPFLKDCIKYMEDRFQKNLDYHVSPIVTTNVIHIKNYNDIHILSQDYFYPYNPFDNKSVNQFLASMITPNTIAIHHWGKSWELKKDKGTGICVFFKNIFTKTRKLLIPNLKTN
jgi:mannosyltransferase OCH1-like enzyme